MGETRGSWEDAVRTLLDDPARADEAYASYFDPPLEAAAERYRRSAEWRAVRMFLTTGDGQAALDLGAGNGIGSYALSREGFTVTAVEPDPSELVGAGAIRRLVEAQGLRVSVVEDWGESLPFPESSFDVVFARQVLHHARTLGQLLRELYRVTKPGGRLIALRDHVVAGEHELPAFFDRHPLHHLYGGENAYPLATYRHAIEDAGFRIRRIFGSFDSPINLAPHTPASLGALARGKFPLPGIGTLVSTLFTPPFSWLSGPLLSALDRRPGRLVSFVADRPR